MSHSRSRIVRVGLFLMSLGAVAMLGAETRAHSALVSRLSFLMAYALHQLRSLTSSVTTSSLLRSAASAAKLVITRWRSTDVATARPSSRPAWGLPSIAARALAPRTRYCDARGPAPHSTYPRPN